MCVSVQYLRHTLGAAPVSFGHVLQWRDQAEGVVAVVTAVTQQETVLLVTSPTRHAHVQVDLHTHTRELSVTHKQALGSEEA